MEKMFNQILQAEMSDHLGADRYERSEDRTGYRNGSYERQLTTRVGQLPLEVPAVRTAPSRRSCSSAISDRRRPWFWR